MEKPRIECEESYLTEEGLTYSKFVAEPLERGYGTTLGNAIRRVLLSGIEGAAITAMRINDVAHEFTSIPGVVEDVIDVVLNLKGVVVKMHGGDTKTATLAVRDFTGVVTAGMIETDADVDIINKDWPIATLDNGSLEMEFAIERGKGFVTAERNRKPNQAVGVIPIDSIFMPVRKVNYVIEDTRVGQMTDFDKLTLEIWTTGAVNATEAISLAADTLIRQFDVFADLARDVIGGGSRSAKEESGKPQPTDMPIEELELSVRAYNCLKRANIYTVGDLLKKTERDLMDIKNFGKKSAEEVIERMRSLGYNMAVGDLDDSYVTSGDL
jgi:DNA-directed RNA polymerase subunit alpha